ncbi:MAG: hypothetical protein M3494_15525 [Actinomycetota bacterium]|jgi:hypothetical protein|nr:hypothetical protein [Rubrobacter sp.]MDQ3509394.1 hypothetical protein [Actinomycetota bacterium]
MIRSPVESSGLRDSGGRKPRIEEKLRVAFLDSRRQRCAEATGRAPYDLLLFAAMFAGIAFRRADEAKS